MSVYLFELDDAVGDVSLEVVSTFKVQFIGFLEAGHDLCVC